jgi:hypothetical protein
LQRNRAQAPRKKRKRRKKRRKGAPVRRQRRRRRRKKRRRKRRRLEATLRRPRSSLQVRSLQILMVFTDLKALSSLWRV